MPSLTSRFGLPPGCFSDDYFYFDISYSGDDLTANAFDSDDCAVAEIHFRMSDAVFYADCDCDEPKSEAPCRHVLALLDELDTEGVKWPARRMQLQWSPTQRSKPQVSWERLLQEAEQDHQQRSQAASSAANRRLHFVIDVQEIVAQSKLTIELWPQRRTKLGRWSKPRLQAVRDGAELSAEDRAVFEFLERTRPQPDRYSYYYYGRDEGISTPFQVAMPLHTETLRKLCATGRCRLRVPGDDADPLDLPVLKWSEETWSVGFKVREQGRGWRLSGEVTRGDERRGFEEIVLFLASGLILFENEVAQFTPRESFSWVALLRREGEIQVPRKDGQRLVERLHQLPLALPVSLPSALEYQETLGTPVPCLQIGAQGRGERMLPADLHFQYGEARIEWRQTGPARVDHQNRHIVLRNEDAERKLRQALSEAEVHPSPQGRYQLAPERLPTIVEQLTNAGWIVEAEGKRLRRSGGINISVKSNVDWFDVDGQFDFDGESAPLPRVLSALRRGEGFVVLDDGSRGLLPELWLKQYGALAQLGEADGDSLRFESSQALLLDALLAAQDNVQIDAKFQKFRDKLQEFEGVAELEPPDTFQGDLRAYQKEGLGWAKFLADFHLGGCLADDMGLGKTVQVLALLESRRRRRAPKDETRRPSLVVVPRSLMFNWLNEAERFTPNLKMLRYFGPDRRQHLGALQDSDVVVTTYGIVRRDIHQLRDVPFDYLVLDEAQAIKNSTAQSAKACRLLQGEHRLALTGTPVENHLGELWSIFEFLNPGMLGRSQAFDQLAREARDSDSPAREFLAKAIRPYILRRTKQQVLTELPEKQEQTIYCEMGKAQRQVYDELRTYYRASLAKKVESNGLGRSKIHVLEALLRLRQASCDPQLIDGDDSAGSAKLDALLEHLRETIDEGHKTLVFSQFTKLLGIVKQRLDKENVAYEYLDGRTRDREAKVRRFQEDKACPVFLISLKAGGNGLNLTAADYVFILDPWWNPAVESQAIDRAHRIGQDKKVFAYRLICRGTVEEKILELQAEKRKLAEAIITSSNSVMRDLTAEDLQLLLS